jgi:hypothetical protein
LAKRTPADTRLLDEFPIGDLVLLAHRITIAIAPAESSVQDVADQADDASREMREDEVEELVRAVGSITRGRRETAEFFAPRRRSYNLSDIALLRVNLIRQAHRSFRPRTSVAKLRI